MAQSRRRRFGRRTTRVTLQESHPAAHLELARIRAELATAELDTFAARNLSRLTSAAAFALQGSPREDVA